MKGIGSDDGESSKPGGGGRLDIYQGQTLNILGIGGLGPGLTGGGAGNCNTAVDGGGVCPLWNTKQALEYYDMVFLACECGENNQTKPPSAMTAMHDWLGEGGKVFATHYQYTWFMNGPTDFQGVATWLGSSIAPVQGPFTLDTSAQNAKGMFFQQWLLNVGAVTPPGTTIPLTANDVRTSVSTVNPPTTRWIYDG